jgi:hypothetical protein
MLDTFDQKYRTVGTVNPDGIKKIVLYEGSGDMLRRIPSEAINNICLELQNYTKKYDIYCLHAPERSKSINQIDRIKYVTTGNTEKDSDFILNLFKSGVDIFVGPDAGLTNLSIAFNIPTIWLESRERIERIVPQCYLKSGMVTLFRNKEFSCAMNCAVGRHIKIYGEKVQPISPWIPEWNYDMHMQLECRKEKIPPCLSFNKISIESLMQHIDFRLTQYKHVI